MLIRIEALADAGWQVTAVDVAAEALARAAEQDPDHRVQWVDRGFSSPRPGAAAQG